MRKGLFILLVALSTLTACSPSIESSQSSSEDIPSQNTVEIGSIDRIPLIFSHDGAPDDISTLVYLARHPEIEILGVIQSYGEQHPSKSLESWQIFLYDVLDYDTARIGVGSKESVDPAQNEFPASWRSGADSFWRMRLPEASQEYPVEDGVDLLIELIHQAEEEVTILITGAHTDVALALQKDETIAENIAQIVVMGGAFDVPGNLYESGSNSENTVAEWNIFVDPLAAKIVFNSGIPISVISLDGSDDFLISQEDVERLIDNDEPDIELLTKLWQQSIRWWGGEFKIWDIVAAVALTNPETITWEYGSMDVIAEQGSTHGQTVSTGAASDIARYSSSTDYEMVRRIIFEVIP